MNATPENGGPQRIQPPNMAVPGGHYSHGTVAGGFVFVSGQLPIAADGTKLNDAPFGGQVAQVLTNIENVLIASGSSIAQLVQVRVYVTNIETWPEFNRLYADWAGVALPSRAVVPVPELHFGFQIEVEAIAQVT
jgi:2-iminobutanoate/2-iminopropanoate deaminase